MSKKEIKALRRPFLKELFRNNKFNLVMTIIAALLGAAGALVISWLLKEVSDLISGDCPFDMGTLLLIAGAGSRCMSSHGSSTMPSSRSSARGL